MSNWLSLPILLIAALMQATFMPQIRILGGAPDLVFLLVLSWAIRAPLETGVTWAFVGGILQDLLSAAPTGTSVPGLILMVFAIHQLSKQVYGIGLAALVGLVIFGTIVQQVGIMVILSMVGFNVSLFDNFTWVVLPTAAYNLIALWPIYWFARRIQRRFTRDGRVIS
jgi:rod shape-determining protein MreD